MAKVGRNDLCPCGSGKKYKKCCEAKDHAPRKLTAHKIESEGASNQASSISELFQRMTFTQPPPLRKEDGDSEETKSKEIFEEPSLNEEEKPSSENEPPEKS